MPSPLGHILGGAAIYLAGAGERHSRTLLACAMIGSVAPDFDFIPGILIGEPAAFHHGISHSLTFAVLFGAMTFLALLRSQSRAAAAEGARMAGFAYALHIVLDLISVTEGRGVPIFWPFSDERFGFDLSLFGHFHHGGLQQGLWSVVRWDNLPALARELLVMGIVVLTLFLWRRRRWGAGAVQWEG